MAIGGFFSTDTTSPTATMGRINPRTAQGTFRQKTPYPNPFMDIAQTYLPQTTKGLFYWCRYYALTNPLVATVLFKRASYPVTDVIYNEKNEGVRERWKHLFEAVFRIRSFLVEHNLDKNCFQGDTPVITEGGTFPIRDLTGQTVNVLSAGGVYRPANFASYGEQDLYDVQLDGLTFRTTAGHRWPVLDTNRRHRTVTTLELKGKSLIRNVAPRPEKNEDYWEGVRNGIVYGDGCVYNYPVPGFKGRRPLSRLDICHPAKRELAQYFDKEATVRPVEGGEYAVIYGLPAKYKELPSASESASYWYGFTSGLLATDGCVDNRGQALITQKNRRVLDLIHDQAARFGMIPGEVQSQDTARVLPGQKDKTEIRMHHMSLKTQWLQPGDFIRTDQRERFQRHYKPTKCGTFARVKDVVPVGRREEVFCCVEPETHTFTLGGGVLTSNCYGNAFISVFFPLKKMLGCKQCKTEYHIRSVEYRFKKYEFHFTCKKCGHDGPAKVRDHFYRSSEELRLVRWNPENIRIQYCEETGERSYYYELPRQTRNDITLGRPHVIEKVPQEYIDAVRKNEHLRFKSGWLYHSKRSTVSGRDPAWGQPLLAQVLKQVFYLQVLQKAQESILFGYIVPMKVIYPAPNGEQTPYSQINLASWRERVNEEIKAHRIDPNYMPILPVPIGYQNIGGEGKALMLANEIRVMSEIIVAGMGWPAEFYFGGISYSGSSVSLKTLENELIADMEDQTHLLQWIISRVAAYMGWPRITTSMRKLKMADDLQRAAFMMQLAQQDMMSKQTFLDHMDLDYEEERKKIEKELLDANETNRTKMELAADTQGRATLIQTRYQMRAQAMMASMQPQQMDPNAQQMDPNAQQPADPSAQQTAGQPQPAVGGGPNAIVGVTSPMSMDAVARTQPGVEGDDSTAAMLAQRIKALPPDAQIRATAGLKSSNPMLYQKVTMALSAPEVGAPLPEKAPPRRGPGKAQI